MTPELISLIGNEIIAVVFSIAVAVILVRCATAIFRVMTED